MAGHGLRRVSCKQEGEVRRLTGGEQEGQELRTLTFGDRTISYDTGLNCIPKYGEWPKYASTEYTKYYEQHCIFSLTSLAYKKHHLISTNCPLE